MKKLSCKEIDPSTDCDFAAEDETNEGVIGKMYEHAKEHHADKLKDMTDEDKAGMNKKMNELIDAKG